MGHSIGLIHLVRACNGLDPLRRFVAAYRTTTGRTPYELVFLCKGNGAVEQVREVAADLTPTIKTVPDRGFDIGSYVRVARVLDHQILCFTNSWARPRVPRWLDFLVAAVRDRTIGIAGATGSLEAVPPHTRFPNPHLRSNAFAIRRDLFLQLHLPEPQDKLNAILLEAGPRGITKQVVDRGLRAVVVSAGGSCHEIAQSRRAGVYRSHNQCNLIVADNITDLYDRSPPAYRADLEQWAWGSAGASYERKDIRPL